MKFNGVSESALIWLREQIITGSLPAGSRINEANLAEEMGISRPPLREALRRLESENLVFGKPRRGSFVSPMSLEDCVQIYRVREILECTAMEIAFADGPETFLPVRETLENAAEKDCTYATGVRSMMECFNSMSSFHRELVHCCKNAWLIQCYDGIYSSLARYQVMYLYIPGSRYASIREHYKIIDMLENGDLEAAQRELVRHLDVTKGMLIDCIEKSDIDHKKSA